MQFSEADRRCEACRNAHVTPSMQTDAAAKLRALLHARVNED